MEEHALANGMEEHALANGMDGFKKEEIKVLHVVLWSFLMYRSAPTLASMEDFIVRMTSLTPFMKKETW